MRSKILILGTVLLIMLGTVSGSTVIDGFEDGDVQEWSGGDESEYSASTQNALKGTYSLFNDYSGDNNKGFSRSITTPQIEGFSFYWRASRIADDGLQTILRDSDGNAIVYQELGGTFNDDFDLVRMNTPNNQVDLAQNQLSGNTWYKTVFEYDGNAQEYYIAIEDTNGNVIDNATVSDSAGFDDPGEIELNSDQDQGSAENYWDNFAYDPVNDPPSIDSKKVDPDPPQIGEDVNYSASTSDPDGSISETCLQVNFSGSQVYSDCKSSSSPSWDQVYKPSSSGWLKATFNTTDNDGATTTESLDRYLSNDAPSPTLNSPSGNKYSYDSSYSFDVSDSDSYPEEDWNCDLKKDGTTEESVYLKEGTNSSYSTNIPSDLGSHTAKVECSDGSGNTDSDSLSYTVKEFRLDNVHAASPIYETTTETFESDFYLGEMVENITAKLYYNGSVVSQETVDQDSGQGNYYSDQDFEIPLVEPNATTLDWNYSFEVVYSSFQSSGTDSSSYNSSLQSQDVYWSYWINDSYAQEDKIIEGETASHIVEVRNKSEKASLDGTLNFTRTSGTNDSVRLGENSTSTLQVFKGDARSGETSQNSRTDRLNTSIEISFNGDSREINASDQVETYKIRIDTCSSLSTEALKFEIYNERDRDQLLKTNMSMAMEVWKDPSQKRVFNASSEEKKTHKICISPSWATFTVDSGDKLIQYQDTKEEFRLRSYFLLEREIDNNTETIELYDVKATESNRIGFEAVDQNGEALPETIIRVERYFPAVDKSLSVAMMRTGSEGRSETFLETNEIYYGFKFYRKDDSGSYQLVQEEPDQIISQDLLTFTIGDSERISYYEFKQGVNYDCQYNATQVQCDYSTEQPIDYMELTVSEDRAVQYEQVCEKTASTDSGELICSGLNATDKDFKYAFKAVTDAGNTVTLETGKSGDKEPSFGITGYVLSFFLFVTLGFAGFAGPRPIPEISVALTSLAVVISYSLGFLGITYQAAATWVILGAVTIWKMRRSTGVGL